MTDRSKPNATKRYQNSDYPSGSFEAAISVDQGATGLRLVREPSVDGRPPDDLEEMVPAFMHRDFFRTEEDGVDAAPTTPAGPASPTTSNSSRPAGSVYLEPPNTEEFEAEPPQSTRPSVPTAVIPPSAAPSRSAPSALKTPPVSNRPVPPPLDISTAAQTEEPLPPLRSQEIPPPPEPPKQAPRRAAAPPTDSAVPATPQSSPASAYSLPLLAALAMVLGVFVWRESTRPVTVTQQTLAVPHTATVADPTGAPSAAAPGFQPKYLSVGPGVPPTLAPSGSPTPAATEEVAGNQEGDDPASLFPGTEPAAAEESATDDADADERADMLSRVAASSAAAEANPEPQAQQAPVRVKSPSGASNAGALFPTDAAPEPVASKPAPKPKPAPKVTAAKPAQKVVNRPSAAELFPIDEEVPVRRPAATAVAQPAEQPPVPALSSEPVAPSRPAGDPYQIDEPNL